jgi:hypothetical protein
MVQGVQGGTGWYRVWGGCLPEKEVKVFVVVVPNAIIHPAVEVEDVAISKQTNERKVIQPVPHPKSVMVAARHTKSVIIAFFSF